MDRKEEKHLPSLRRSAKRSESMESLAVDRRPANLPPQIRRSPSVPALCALLLLAVILVFGQTAGHDFVNFDDGDYVYENLHVMRGLTGAGTVWAFTQRRVAAHWHPLTWLSLMADAQVLKLGAGPVNRVCLAVEMHLVNVALHAANALLLFLLLRAMTASVWRSALVAAVFAVHPVHVESVAWITERKDVLSGLFGLLALWAYAWYAGGPSVPRYLAVAAALTLGLMAKPTLVTWPLLFLLLDYWPLQRQFGLRLLLEKAPLFLLVAASATITFLAQQSGGTVVSLESVPISARIARGRSALRHLPWQDPLAGKPGSPVSRRGDAELLAGVGGRGFAGAAHCRGLVGGVARAALAGRGWFWYLGTLLPTIGLVQVGLQVMADRFLYLPQIGICVALAWALGTLPALGSIVVAGWRPSRPC